MIYKILTNEQWQKFQRTGNFVGSPVDLADGYIHFSTALQLAQTAAKHFAQMKDLILLEVDEQDFGDELKFEPSRGGDRFPHLYANLSLDQVSNCWPLPLNSKSGQHEFPSKIPL